VGRLVNRIAIDLAQRVGSIDRNIFGGFVEHLGRCVYEGIFDPGSPLSRSDGLRTDVLEAARRLAYSNIRYPGGNFVSAYRWRDGVGPIEERPVRSDPAWDAVDPNTFGTNEFIGFCRALGAEPYFVVNAGDGDMREARDWVEYCNGTTPTALTRLRAAHGFAEPHRIRYWGIGNEVDGAWQVGFKTPAEYARTYHEFAKVMRWVDPSIKLIASAVSDWDGDPVERIQALVEEAPDEIDYLSIHWYVGDRTGDLRTYLAVSEQIEDRLTAIEGLSRALTLKRRPRPPIPIAVDEWNVWYRATPDARNPAFNGLEEMYDLADALVVAMHLNAFIRHASSVRMANLAQLVNVIAPMITTPDGLLLQTTFYPFELFARTCGDVALAVTWSSETFSAGEHSGVRLLDVAASLDERARRVSVYIVNRDPAGPQEAEVRFADARPQSEVSIHTITGPGATAVNTWDEPTRVITATSQLSMGPGAAFTTTLPALSVTALTFTL
jgi:alpha-N-arabinofuranosidase